MTNAPTLDTTDASANGTLSFEDVLEHVAMRREEFARQKFVPRDMIDEFKQIGIYRAATPPPIRRRRAAPRASFCG